MGFLLPIFPLLFTTIYVLDMSKINIPSYSYLIPREKRIRYIQMLCEAFNNAGIDTLNQRIQTIETMLVEEGDPTDAIDKWNEIIDFLKNIDNTDSLIGILVNYVQKSQLADYTPTSTLNTLLAGKQDVINDLSDIRSGAAAGATAYQKPQGGIPSTDMSSAVQTSLGKADTALQQHQDVSGKEDVTTIVAPVNTTDVTLPITSLTCEIGTYYRLDIPVETLTVTLPAMTNVTTTKTVLIYLTGGTAPGVTFSAIDGKTVDIQKGFDIKADEGYEINCLYNGISWVITHVVILNS